MVRYGIYLKIKFSDGLSGCVESEIYRRAIISYNFLFFVNFIPCFRQDVNSFECLLVFVAKNNLNILPSSRRFVIK